MNDFAEKKKKRTASAPAGSRFDTTYNLAKQRLEVDPDEVRGVLRSRDDGLSCPFHEDSTRLETSIVTFSSGS